MKSIVEISEFIQKKFGESLKFENLQQTGPGHCPVITEDCILPNGASFTGRGKNKKEARLYASNDAYNSLI